MTPLIQECLLAFIVSILTCLALVRLARRHGTGHDDSLGPQRLHAAPRSRLGGAAVMAALALPLMVGALVLQQSSAAQAWQLGAQIALSALPVFGMGLLEDVTRRVSARRRLLAAMASALLGVALVDAQIGRTDVWPIDVLLAVPLMPTATTLLVVGGFTHSVNLIDGVHGLAAGCLILMLVALAVIASGAGATNLAILCVVAACALAGFMTLNWPRGKIFLGDAGAYLGGFIVVEIGILLSQGGHGVSPMAPVLIGVYPLFETLFSMWRRARRHRSTIGSPDRLHLHSLVYRRLLHSSRSALGPRERDRRNAATAKYLWALSTPPAVLAVLIPGKTLWLLVGIVVFALAYIAVYRSLCHFHVPRPIRTIQAWFIDRHA